MYDEVGSKEVNQTKKGYLRAPSIDLVIDWALKSWNDVPNSLIEDSFKHCGLYLNFYLT